MWPANKKISPRTHPSVPEDKSDSRGKSKGLGGPPYSRGNLVGDAEVPGGFDGRGVTARERNLERERGRERAPDGHWDGADSAFSPHNPESMRMAMLRGMFPPGIPPEAFAERGPPPGFPPGGPGWLPPGMMPPYEHLRASPGFPEYIKEGVSSRGGDPRALLGAGGLGPGGPTDPMAVAAAMHQHWAAQQGGKGQAPSPTALNNGKMKPSQSSKVNSPTDGREEARMDHRLREEGREGLQGVPAGPTVMWRAEVQPPESKDSHKMVLFKIKAHIPAWLKSKLPPALVVKGFTPRNSIDMSGIHIKPLVLELDELVDQQRLDLNMMIVDRVAIMCELPDLHLALVPHRNQYASLHILGMILPKRHAMAEFEQGFMANSY